MEETIKNEEKTLLDPVTKRFAKGNPGGPGRPKGSYSLVEAIRRKLEEIPEGKDKTYGEYFIEQVMKKTVIEGDVPMMRDILNRVDGMPQQKVDMTTLGDKINGVIMLPQRNDGSLETSEETDSSSI